MPIRFLSGGFCETQLQSPLHNASTNSHMTVLARKLGLHDYFSLAFGAMIGVGWLVLWDDWLGRGGPCGAMVGFAMWRILARFTARVVWPRGPALARVPRSWQHAHAL